jgi:hypothetical protein
MLIRLYKIEAVRVKLFYLKVEECDAVRHVQLVLFFKPFMLSGSVCCPVMACVAD